MTIFLIKKVQESKCGSNPNEVKESSSQFKEESGQSFEESGQRK